MSSAALDWLRAYEAHCRAILVDPARLSVDPDHLAACQEFDTALRSLDVAALQAAAATTEGAQLFLDIRSSQEELAAVVERTGVEVQERCKALRKGADALRGYGEAGGRGGAGARFLSRRG